MAATLDTRTLLDDPIAQDLLRSTIPARLAYTGTDGAPRVIPIWFHWDGAELVFGSPPGAAKVAAIRAHPEVAVSIDGNDFPHKVLLLRGAATVETVDGVAPEYAASARRYFGEAAGTAWAEQIGGMFSTMARIALRPEHVTILDFQTRFPQEIARAMAGAAAD